MLFAGIVVFVIGNNFNFKYGPPLYAFGCVVVAVVMAIGCEMAVLKETERAREAGIYDEFSVLPIGLDQTRVHRVV